MSKQKIQQQRDEARAKIRVLEKALQPFSHPDLSQMLSNNVQGEDSIVFQRNDAILTIGDFERAKVALRWDRRMSDKYEFDGHGINRNGDRVLTLTQSEKFNGRGESIAKTIVELLNGNTATEGEENASDGN